MTFNCLLTRSEKEREKETLRVKQRRVLRLGGNKCQKMAPHSGSLKSERNVTQPRRKSPNLKDLLCHRDMQIFSLSPSTGLAAPRPLTERRKRRAQRNTSETGECVIRDASAQERRADILKASSAAAVTLMGVGERWWEKDKKINGGREIKCGKSREGVPGGKSESGSLIWSGDSVHRKAAVTTSAHTKRQIKQLVQLLVAEGWREQPAESLQSGCQVKFSVRKCQTSNIQQCLLLNITSSTFSNLSQVFFFIVIKFKKQNNRSL